MQQTNYTIQNLQRPKQGKQSKLGNKMDKYFYSQILAIKKLYIGITILRILKPIIYMVLIVLINTQQIRNNNFWGILYTQFAIFIMLIVGIVGFIIFNYSNSTKNNIFFVEAAKRMGHAVLEQNIKQNNDLQMLQKCVSQNRQNVQNQNPQNDCYYDCNTKSQIMVRVFTQNTVKNMIFVVFQILDILLTWAMIIFVIVKAAKGQLQQFNDVQIKCLYVVLALNPINVFMFCCLCLALSLGLGSSLIAGLCVICYKSFNKILRAYRKYQELNKIIKTKEYVNENNLQKQCSICLEQFKDKIVIAQLGCPHHHIYHQQCINQWLNKINTCPLCRCQIYDKKFVNPLRNLNHN